MSILAKVRRNHEDKVGGRRATKAVSDFVLKRTVEQGIDRRQLVERLDVDYAELEQLISGRRDYTVGQLFVLARMFGMNTVELYEIWETARHNAEV